MLETVWFCIWGFTWAVYFMLDGFDLGIGSMQPILAKNNRDRRDLYLSMGPFWDANEVWLVAAGGITFAAFPSFYASMFSALYSPLMLILFALILRAASIEFGEDASSPAWKSIWQWCLALSSFLPAFLFGVIFANIFLGMPIDASGIYNGPVTKLLNSYTVAGGTLFVLIFALHGCLWITVKVQGPLQARAGRWAVLIWHATLVMAVVFLSLSAAKTDLFGIYMRHWAFWFIPLIFVVAMSMTRLWIGQAHWLKAWWASCISILSLVTFGLAGLYPFLLKSSLDKTFSLTIHNAASSPMTLKIMLAVVLVFVPIIIIYQGWVYLFFGGKTDEDTYPKH